ncbi:hypothetical protein Fmac_011279 [Flemingia macrophylla]|uniref:Uncharacterized protein n=1 Tax=Flemingia macrophylla TaxID=520843 RepID=A0ABD1MLZ5_9FABA
MLSHPEGRALHDLHLHRTAAAAVTFWTACPHCWNLFEYPKSNHDCALHCQVCAKSFRGESVMLPLKLGDAVVEGEQLRQYYSCEANVPEMCYELPVPDIQVEVSLSHGLRLELNTIIKLMRRRKADDESLIKKG